jgi:hypothetical protein
MGSKKKNKFFQNMPVLITDNELIRYQLAEKA